MADDVRILVIDDNQESCQIISDILDSAGYLVEVAHDGETGLNKVKFSIKQEHPYTLCITDVMLPKVSGIDILRQVKELTPNIGVIVISAFDEVDPFLKKEAVNYGAFKFLPKPIPPGKLLAIVKEYLSTLKIHKSEGSESTRAKIPFFGTTKKHTQRIDRQSLAHPTPPPAGAGSLLDGPIPAGLEHLSSAAPPPPPDEQDHITRPVPDASHFKDITDESEIRGSGEMPYKVIKCPMCSKMVKIAVDGSNAKIWCSSCGILFDREDAEVVAPGMEAARQFTVPEPSTYQNPLAPDPPSSSTYRTPPPPPIPRAPVYVPQVVQDDPLEMLPGADDSPLITSRTAAGLFEAEETDTSSGEFELPPSRGTLLAAGSPGTGPASVIPPVAQVYPDGEFRLLIVEDDPHAGEILQTALDVAGYTADIVETGNDAYAQISEGFAQGIPYTLVISDVMIPGINGLDLMKKVRSEYRNAIDFILVSAYEDEQLSLQKQAEMEGALTFFSKPYDYKMLINFIHRFKEQKK